MVRGRNFCSIGLDGDDPGGVETRLGELQGGHGASFGTSSCDSGHLRVTRCRRRGVGGASDAAIRRAGERRPRGGGPTPIGKGQLFTPATVKNRMPASAFK